MHIHLIMMESTYEAIMKQKRDQINLIREKMSYGQSKASLKALQRMLDQIRAELAEVESRKAKVESEA